MNNCPSWIVPDWNVPDHVKAVTTTKEGGVSSGAYASMNLALHVGDNAAMVAKNRQNLIRQLRLPGEPAWLNQVHGNRIIELQTNSNLPADADGSVSRRPGVVCVVMTADCLPVLLSDRQGRCVAAVHAGWRGLAAGVIEQAVQVMQRKPHELSAWLGPAIGPQAFEVGNEVKESFIKIQAMAEHAFLPSENGRWLANIYELAKLRLRRIGVENIFGGTFCTFTQDSLFYSYRREKTTGRMASLIWIE